MRNSMENLQMIPDSGQSGDDLENNEKFKVWKTVELGSEKDDANYEKRLRSFGVDIDNELETKQMLESELFKTATEKEKINLIKVSSKDFGFEQDFSYSELYEKAISAGLKKCPAEVGPVLAIKIKGTESKNEAVADSLYIAMDPIEVKAEHPGVKELAQNIFVVKYIVSQHKFNTNRFGDGVPNMVGRHTPHSDLSSRDINGVRIVGDDRVPLKFNADSEFIFSLPNKE